jgi:hypothetical protein
VLSTTTGSDAERRIATADGRAPMFASNHAHHGMALRSAKVRYSAAILSTHSELARDVTEHSFSAAWTTILAER